MTVDVVEVDIVVASEVVEERAAFLGCNFLSDTNVDVSEVGDAAIIGFWIVSTSALVYVVNTIVDLIFGI